MSRLSMDYRLSLYTQLVELSQNKIYIVQSSLDDKLYIKKFLYPDNYEVYTKIKEISSPNIPKVYDLIESENRLVVIEEYVNGSTLDEILKECKALPEKIVVDYAIELCNILERLHNCEPAIIHRDIKPSNIIINNDNVLKLIDFDVSRTHKDSRSADTKMLGTHGYAAPEQFGFSQSDPRTDIYSLGITINVMLTGKFPIDSMSKSSMNDIISKCTKLDPDSRFQNIRELKHSLLEKANYHNSKSSSPTYRNNKLPGFRSNKTLFKTLGSVWYGLLLLTGLGFFTEDLTLENRITDIIITLFFLITTLLLANYKDLNSKLPLLSSRHFLVQLMGYGLYLMILLFIVGALLPS